MSVLSIHPQQLLANYWDTHHFEQALVWLAVEWLAVVAVIAPSLRALVRKGGELAILA